MAKSIDPSDIPEFPERNGVAMKLLKNGDEIFPAMLEEIRNAASTINLETYVYWSGDIADEVAESLAKAAERGVEVRVVLDWYGSQQMNRELVRLMDDAGVHVRYFRPLRWFNFRRANHRTHRKLMIVDGRVGFLGGVGIAEEWTGDAQDSDHWRDNHYRVEGPVVGDLQRLFFSHWSEEERPPEDSTLFYPELKPAGALTAQVIGSEPEEAGNKIEEIYLRLVKGARDRFMVVAPYFAPSDGLLEEMEKAARRGVRVEVVAAGRNNDMRVVRKAFRHDWGQLLEAGVNVYEYHRTLIHVKLLIVDEDQLFVGSANFDLRSMRLNGEASMLVRSREMVEIHERVFEEDRADAEQVNYQMWRDRPLWTKAKDGMSHLLRKML